MGSVKDRMARAVIERAEQSGALEPGQTVIEATSGNTGIGLAMVCAQKGYPLVVTMAESFSVERRKLLRFLGARVVLTPASEKGSGMLAKAVELAEKHGWYLCRQFENEANADVHSRTTAQEILADFAGERLDYWVSGFGTGGTLKGVARALRQARPATKIIVAEPDNAQVLGSGIPQRRDAPACAVGKPSALSPAPDAGMGARFHLPADRGRGRVRSIDEIVPVAGNDALRLARELARQEGIFVGTSSGATLAAALEIARRSPPGTNIVCMLPDTGERYLSTPAVRRHRRGDDGRGARTVAFDADRRFDAPPPMPPVVQPTVDARARRVRTPLRSRLVDAAHSRRTRRPVCARVVRVLLVGTQALHALGIQYRSVDLDSTAYQPDDLGNKIRAVLGARTGAKTIPQIFIGDEHIGGCTDLFDAWREGSIQRRLAQ